MCKTIRQIPSVFLGRVHAEHDTPLFDKVSALWMCPVEGGALPFAHCSTNTPVQRRPLVSRDRNSSFRGNADPTQKALSSAFSSNANSIHLFHSQLQRLSFSSIVNRSFLSQTIPVRVPLFVAFAVSGSTSEEALDVNWMFLNKQG